MEKVRGDLCGERAGHGGTQVGPAGRGGDSRQAKGMVTGPRLANHFHHKGLTVGQAEGCQADGQGQAQDTLQTLGLGTLWGAGRGGWGTVCEEGL